MSKKVSSSSRNKKRNKSIIFSALGLMTILSASLGVFSNFLIDRGAFNDGIAASDKTSNAVTLPSEGSLSKYWDSLSTSNLLNSETSISNFVDQNGAIFENLVASENYKTSSALNQVVSTSKQISLDQSSTARTEIINVFKKEIEQQSKKFYDWGATPIEDADDYITRIISTKNMYPHFHDAILRKNAQNYGIWVREGFMAPDQFTSELPKDTKNEGREITTVYLRSNYKEKLIEDSLGAYSSALYKSHEWAAAQQMGTVGGERGNRNGNYDASIYYGSYIKEHRNYITGKYISTLMMLADNKEDMQTFANELFSLALWRNGTHSDKKRFYEDMVTCAWTYPIIGWITCGPIAGKLTPSSFPNDSGNTTHDRWTNTEAFDPKKVYENLAYPDQIDTNDIGVDEFGDNVIYNAPVSIDTSKLSPSSATTTNSVMQDIRNRKDDWQQKGWSETAGQLFKDAEDRVNAAATKTQMTEGRNRARADLEFLSNVYFDKVAKEWQEEMQAVSGGDEYIYFDNIIDDGENSVVSLMHDEMYKSVWNKALRDYLVQIENDLRTAAKNSLSGSGTSYSKGDIELKYADHRDSKWFTKAHVSYGGDGSSNWELAQLKGFIGNAHDKLQYITSEENKKRILEEKLDAAWEANKGELEKAIEEKLEANKKDARVEFAKMTEVMEDYLIDPYVDGAITVAIPTTNTVNEKSIPEFIGADRVNFGYIPSGNPGIAAGGASDPRAQDVLDKFLTANITLASLLEKDNPVGGILSGKSILAQSEYITSLFAVIRRDVLAPLKKILERFSNQTEQQFNIYLELAQKAVDTRLTLFETNKYFATNVYTQQKVNEYLLEADVVSVSLAEGFLLDVIEVPRFSNSDNLKTLWQMIEEDTELKTFIRETQENLLTT